MAQSLVNFLIAAGPLGIFLFSFADSAGIPLPGGADAWLVFMSVKEPERASLGAAVAVLGSVGGNVLLFLMARRGGRRFMERTESPGRARTFRLWFHRYGLATVFIPALVPIPLPLKIFVISAGVLHVRLLPFVLVVLAARIFRYATLAYLGVQLGEHSAAYLKDNAWNFIGAAVLMGLLSYGIIRLSERVRMRRTTE